MNIEERKVIELAIEWIEKQPEETPHSKYDLDTRYVVLRELEAALAQPEQSNTCGEPDWKGLVLSHNEDCESRCDMDRCGYKPYYEYSKRRCPDCPVHEKIWVDDTTPPQPKEPEQKPVAWKLVPIEPTREMLEAMDECSIEGYDEHLYAGHAASVYMAAVDVAPTPPQPEKPDQDEVDIRSRLYQRIHELETQLAQPEQEPVAWADHGVVNWIADKQFKHASLLYTTPPHRKPLSDEQLKEIWLKGKDHGDDWLDVQGIARAIEAAHGIKE